MGRVGELDQNPLAFGLLESGAVAAGLGECARLGCRPVRPAPDMERFYRPSAAFFVPDPRGRVRSPRPCAERLAQPERESKSYRLLVLALKRIFDRRTGWKGFTKKAMAVV